MYANLKGEVKMKAIFLASLFFMAFQGQANATVTLWQAIGVSQYEEANQTMVASTFDVGNLLSLDACNKVIADHNQLLQVGSVTPSGGQANLEKNTRSAVDAICYQVSLPQLPGWYFIGQAQVKQGAFKAQPLQVKIGPFAAEQTCKDAGNAQKKLTLQQTPITGQTVNYKLNGACRKLMD